MQNSNHIYQLPTFSQSRGIIYGYSTTFFGDMGDIDAKMSDGLKKFAVGLQIDPEDLVRMRQIHSTNTRVVTKENRGESISDVDALVTKDKNLFLSVRIADCLPVLMYEKKAGIVAAIHAGWRGIYNGILYETIKVTQQEGGSVQDISVGIGPSIRLCCYAVDEERKDMFIAKYPEWGDKIVEKRDGKWFLDLQKTAKLQLIDRGIDEDRIDVSSICTHDSQDFFSYRQVRDKEWSKRFTGIIGLV